VCCRQHPHGRPATTTFEELTALAVDVPGWMQMCAAKCPTVGKSRGGGTASGSSPAAPSTALNPNATVHNPGHQSQSYGHNDGGLDVQGPGGDGGGAADPTKRKEIHGQAVLSY